MPTQTVGDLLTMLSASTESFRVYVHDEEEEGSAAAAEEWASKRDDSAMMSRGVSGTLNISVDKGATLEIEMEEAAMRQFRTHIFPGVDHGR